MMMVQNYAKIKKENIFLAIILILSFALSFYNWYDITLGGDIPTLRPVIHFLKGEGFFPFQKPWVGGNILIIPFFLISGFNVFAYRVAESVFMTLTILLFYLFVKEFYGTKTALLCSLFLAISPYFILMKLDEITFYPFFTASILLFLYKYYKTEKIKYLLLASLIAGYGIYFKLIILYLVISVFVPFFFVKFVLTRPLKIKFKNFRIAKKHVIFAVVFFLIGSSPLIIYNFGTGFSTLHAVSSNFFTTEAYGYNNFAIIENLQERVKQFMHISSENSTFFSHFAQVDISSKWRYREDFSFNIFLFFVSIPVILWFKSKKDYFLIGMFFVFLFLSTFVITMLRSHHLFLIFPIFILIISRFLTLPDFKTKKCIIFVILILVFSFLNIQTTVEAINTLKNQTWLEDYLPERAIVHEKAASYLKDAPYVVMYVEAPVLYYSTLLQQKGDLFILCSLIYSEPPALDCSHAEGIPDNVWDLNETLYIFPSLLRTNSDDRKIFGGICHSFEKTNPCDIPFKIFQEKLNGKNRIMVLETRMNDSRGYPVYDIYSTRTL